MNPTRSICNLAAVLAGLAAASPALADVVNPDWPCMQRKVPELSLAQVWSGPDIPDSAKDWANDPDIARRVEDLSARRLPVSDAEQQIKDYAAGLPSAQLMPKMTMLEQGLFEHMNSERSNIIDGITRYAHKQLDLAAELRKEATEVDNMEDDKKTDPKVLAQRQDQLASGTRIFQERVKSLTYVCEVPTIIEQRLYQLSKAVADTLATKK